jgi:hypothetical protein
MEIHGSLFAGYTQACINLKIVVGKKAAQVVEGIRPDLWYRLEGWQKLGELVTNAYDDPAPIMEQVGVEMMKSWYLNGPGRNLIARGAEFLKFQTGSDGYRSVVKGPPSIIGDFSLVHFDENKGEAVILSTTPFNRDMERGVIIGGMQAPGDLIYVDVDNSGDRNRFLITFA